MRSLLNSNDFKGVSPIRAAQPAGEFSSSSIQCHGCLPSSPQLHSRPTPTSLTPTSFSCEQQHLEPCAGNRPIHSDGTTSTTATTTTPFSSGDWDSSFSSLDDLSTGGGSTFDEHYRYDATPNVSRWPRCTRNASSTSESPVMPQRRLTPRTSSSHHLEGGEEGGASALYSSSPTKPQRRLTPTTGSATNSSKSSSTERVSCIRSGQESYRWAGSEDDNSPQQQQQDEGHIIYNKNPVQAMRWNQFSIAEADGSSSTSDQKSLSPLWRRPTATCTNNAATTDLIMTDALGRISLESSYNHNHHDSIPTRQSMELDLLEEDSDCEDEGNSDSDDEEEDALLEVLFLSCSTASIAVGSSEQQLAGSSPSDKKQQALSPNKFLAGGGDDLHHQSGEWCRIRHEKLKEDGRPGRPVPRRRLHEMTTSATAASANTTTPMAQRRRKRSQRRTPSRAAWRVEDGDIGTTFP